MSTTADATPAEAGRISWFRYVSHGKVARYQATGWSVIDGPMTHHQAYSVLMKYDGPASDIEPPMLIERRKVIPVRRVTKPWLKRW